LEAVGRKFSHRAGNHVTVGLVRFPSAGETAAIGYAGLSSLQFFNLDGHDTIAILWLNAEQSGELNGKDMPGFSCKIELIDLKKFCRNRFMHKLYRTKQANFLRCDARRLFFSAF